jgi:hypothetical protein
VQRARSTALLGSGPDVAIKYFRTFAAIHETSRWDKSVYYQIYLASRILASGGRLAAVGVSAVRKDVRVNGKTVETYATRAAAFPWDFQSRHTGLDSVLRVTADAISPNLAANEYSTLVRRAASQILRITYPFWLFEYRRAANWSAAVGVARGMWPGKLLGEYKLKAVDIVYLWVLYFAVTSAGLTFPTQLFTKIKGSLSDWIRRRQQQPIAIS